MNKDKVEVVRKLNQDIMSLINDIQKDENFKIEFNTAAKNQGYFFSFPKYPDIQIAASSHKRNFLKIKFLRDCILADNTWKKYAYANSKDYSTDVFFNEDDGLSLSNLFSLIKLCSDRLGLTLNYELDKEKIELNTIALNLLFDKQREEKRKNRQDKAMTSDLTLIKLFDYHFSIPDYVVLEHFLWAMGRDDFKAENVIQTVREVWSEMDNKNKSMVIYMPLISLHVKERMH